MEISLDRVGDAGAVLIAGPTASGKSAAALRLADAAARRGRTAWIVNVDSMQVYDALRILTARPGHEEEAVAPHRLYGHVPAATRYSVGAWLGDAGAVLAEAEQAGALPIVVGGTGLYFKALTEGLAAVPAIDAAVREGLAARLAGQGAAALHAELAERDPAAAAAIRPGDPRRIVRALEVIESTGHPLARWQQAQPEPPVRPDRTLRMVIEPDRETLYRSIGERLDKMVEAGALEEVGAVMRLRLGPDLPVMKAIGLRELSAVLDGGVGLAEALERAKTETRRYAKRQLTWFRNQMRGWPRTGG